MNGKDIQVGIISDTHSYFDNQLSKVFNDCHQIWHAGDIGDIEVVKNLDKIAPIKAVHGNIDDASIRQHFPEDLWFNIGEIKVFITHIAAKPPRYNPRVLKLIKTNKPNVLICGHSHILKVMPDKENKLLFINPGAAGQQGFHSIRTVLKMKISGNKIIDMAAVELGKRGK